MKKGISITLHIITFVLIGLLITSTILMYFNTQEQFEKYDKEIDELKEENKTLSDTFRKNENNEPSNDKDNDEEPVYDVSSFDKIKVSEIASKSKGETIVIMIGREGCGWCSRYIPILKSAQEEYNFKAKYIDLATIVDIKTFTISDQEAYNTLINIPAEPGFEDFLTTEFGATPLTIIVKDNKIINAFAGYVEESYLSSILESSGFTK